MIYRVLQLCFFLLLSMPLMSMQQKTTEDCKKITLFNQTVVQQAACVVFTKQKPLVESVRKASDFGKLPNQLKQEDVAAHLKFFQSYKNLLTFERMKAEYQSLQNQKCIDVQTKNYSVQLTQRLSQVSHEQQQLIKHRIEADKKLNVPQLIDQIQALQQNKVKLFDDYNGKVQSPSFPRSALEYLELEFDKAVEDVDVLDRADHQALAAKLDLCSLDELNKLAIQLDIQVKAIDPIGKKAETGKLTSVDIVKSEIFKKIRSLVANVIIEKNSQAPQSKNLRAQSIKQDTKPLAIVVPNLIPEYILARERRFLQTTEKIPLKQLLAEQKAMDEYAQTLQGASKQIKEGAHDQASRIPALEQIQNQEKLREEYQNKLQQKIDHLKKGHRGAIAALKRSNRSVDELIDHLQELSQQSLDQLKEYRNKISTSGLPQSSLEKFELEFDRQAETKDIIAQADEELLIEKISILPTTKLHELCSRLSKLQTDCGTLHQNGHYASKFNEIMQNTRQRLDRIEAKISQALQRERCAELERHNPLIYEEKPQQQRQPSFGSTLLKIMGSSGALKVGAGVTWGGGQPADLTGKAGQLSATITLGEKDESDPQLLAATRENHQRLRDEQEKKDVAQSSTIHAEPAPAAHSASVTQTDSVEQAVQQAIRPMQRCEFKLFDDNRKELISFSDHFAKKGEQAKAKQLVNCAEFWGQQTKDLTPNKTNIATITDLGDSLHIFVQEASTTTDGVKQEFIYDTVTTVTAGSEVVLALEKAGQHEAAEFFKTAIKEKLGHIETICQHKSCTISSETKKPTFELLAADKALMPQLTPTRKLDESTAVNGIVISPEMEFKVLRGMALGIVDGVVIAADPRNMVTGAVHLIKMGGFVVEQLGRLEAYQEAIECGNWDLAAKYEADFKAANAGVASAAAKWYTEFKALPAEEQARFISSFVTTLAVGKPIANFEMGVLGAAIGGISKGAAKAVGKVSTALKAEEVAVAMTPEGIGVAVKVAEELGTENAASQGLTALEETDNAAAGATSKIAMRYSGDLVKVPKPDSQAEKLFAQRFAEGKTCVKFTNDPDGKEFDIITKEFIVETKPPLDSIGSPFRKQAKRAFEAAKQTNRKVYFHFDGEPCSDIINKLHEYQKRYGIEMIIDTKPL